MKLDGAVKVRRELTDRVRSRVFAGVNDLLTEVGLEKVKERLRAAIGGAGEDLDEEVQLERFYQIMALHSLEGMPLSASESKGYLDLAADILKFHGISPVTSTLSHLHGERSQAIALQLRRQGDHWAANWQNQLSGLLSKRSPLPAHEMAYVTATGALRQGNIRLALEGYSKAEELAATDQQIFDCRLGRVKVLRILGARRDALSLIEETEKLTFVSTAMRTQLTWQGLCVNIAANSDLNDMQQRLTRDEAFHAAEYQLEFQLWARSVSSKKYMERLPRVETIRRRFRAEVKRPHPLAQLLEVCQALEQAYDQEIPLHLRIDALGSLPEKAKRLQQLDHELLALAGCVRQLTRFHQYMFAELVRSEYRALCLRLTEGADGDVLRLLEDVENRAWFHLEPALRDQTFAATSAATAGGARRTGLARLGLGITSIRLKHSIKRAFADEGNREFLKEREWEELASYLLNASAGLRGPTIKMIQLGRLFGESLPAPLRRALDQSFDKMPPMSVEEVETVMRNELGGAWRDHFAEFDYPPVAAASLGQVHRAVLHSGQVVAVKVQYLGVEESMKKDMVTLRLLLPFYRWLFPKANVKQIVMMSEEGFLVEADYLREARMQSLMRAHYEGDSSDRGVYIPRVFTELSTKRLLVMEFVEGERLDEYRVRVTQEERDVIARRIVKESLRAFMNFGVYNGDPHPGNFLVLEDGRLAMLDFGYTFETTQGRRVLWRRIIEVSLADDFDEFQKVLIELGYVADVAKFKFRLAFENAKRICELGSAGPDYQVNEAAARDLATGLTVKAGNRKAITLPLADFAAPRFFFGLITTIAKLGGCGPWTPLFEEVLAEDLHELKVVLHKALPPSSDAAS